MTAYDFCLTSAGAFFLVGLLAGAWKYLCIARSSDAKAPYYVDTAHRASLLYAFACALLGELSKRSSWSNGVNLAASIVVVLFFAAAVAGYLVHGALRDTENQFERPHRLGRRTVKSGVMLGFMVLLMLAEIGGFVVLFSGHVLSP